MLPFIQKRLYPGQDCFDAEREQLATSILLVPATNLQRTTPIDSYFLHLPSHLCFEWSLCLDLQRYYQMRTLRGIQPEADVLGMDLFMFSLY